MIPQLTTEKAAEAAERVKDSPRAGGFPSDVPGNVVMRETINNLISLINSQTEQLENPLINTIVNNLHLIRPTQHQNIPDRLKSHTLIVDPQWAITNPAGIETPRKTLTEEPQAKKKRKSSPSITITNIQDSKANRDLFELGRKISESYAGYEDARVLPSGDVRIWFKDSVAATTAS